MIETELKARSDRAEEHQHEHEVALREGQRHEPEPREQGPEEQHDAQVEPIDEVADDGAGQRDSSLANEKGSEVAARLRCISLSTAGSTG